MALSARDFKITGQWAKGANTTIPPIPVSGQAYRRSTLTQAQAETGTPYDTVWESSSNNQKDFEVTGMGKECEVYGWPRWSPLTNYIANASFCLGTDGIPYRAILDSGPGISGVGPKDPTTTTGYWLALGRWLGVLPTPTAAQTFYFREDGSDSNDGTAGDANHAFRTLAGGITKILSTQSTSPYVITFDLGNGEFGDGNPVSINPGALSSVSVSIIGQGIDVTTISYTGPLNFTFSVGAGFLALGRLGLIGTFTSQIGTQIGGALHVYDGTVQILDGVKLSITPNASITNTCAFVRISNNGHLTTGNVSATSTLTMVGKAVATCISTTGNGQWTVGAAGGATILDVGSVTGGATFISMTNSSQVTKFSGTLTVSGAQTGIGARYYIQYYSFANTSGGGANFFPGTIAGTVNTATYGLYV